MYVCMCVWCVRCSHTYLYICIYVFMYVCVLWVDLNAFWRDGYVCMYVSMYVCIRVAFWRDGCVPKIYIYIYIYIYGVWNVCMCVTCVTVYGYKLCVLWARWVFVCMYMCMDVCVVCVCVRTCVYIYIYVFMYVCMYAYITTCTYFAGELIIFPRI